MDIKTHSKAIKNIADELSPEEVYQARLIVARQKFWTPDIEKLLRKWRRQISELQREHKLAETKYNKRYYLLGVPATIFSTVVASGILTTFKNCNQCIEGCVPQNTGNCENDEMIRLAMGVIGIIAIIFTSLSVFLNYGQASRESKSSSDDFGALIRKIDAVLEAPISSRDDPITFLNTIRSEYDDVSKNTPISTFKPLEYKTVENRKLGPPAPDQVNISKKAKVPDASSLAKILMDNLEADANEMVVVQEKIQKENDHDTDDEKDVTIAIDFEEYKPEDLLKNRNVVQQSLAKALEFELSRMYSEGQEEKKDKLEAVDEHKKKKRVRKKVEVPKEKEEAN